MRKSLFMPLLFLAFIGCNPKSKTILVINSLDADRTEEIVELPANQLSFTQAAVGQYALVDEQGNSVPYQILYKGTTEPQAIIFQTDVQSLDTARYYWRKATPATAEAKVYARYIPERKDDFAWESQTAAYRMYGPALADENPSNGVDLWLKSTDELVVDSFYYREHQLGYSYHINWGKGLDCYKVGHTLGCGGVAPYVAGQLLVHNHYNQWEIIEQGPLRVRFRLTYDDMAITITADAGNPFNRAQVVYTGTCDTLHLAAGIYLHDRIDNLSFSKEKGWAAYAENAVSDAGVPQGRNYAAVILPAADDIRLQEQTFLCLAPYNKGDTLNYWFAGGWSRWKYPTDTDWFVAVAAAAKMLNEPLLVAVK